MYKLEFKGEYKQGEYISITQGEYDDYITIAFALVLKDFDQTFLNLIKDPSGHPIDVILLLEAEKYIQRIGYRELYIDRAYIKSEPELKTKTIEGMAQEVRNGQNAELVARIMTDLTVKDYTGATVNIEGGNSGILPSLEEQINQPKSHE